MTEMERIEKYIERTKFRNEHYALTFNEMVTLAKMTNETPLDAIVKAFTYGRAKGYRAAKKEVTA